jgi:fucose 4-O-acetylase-like acetyltransferase
VSSGVSGLLRTGSRLKQRCHHFFQNLRLLFISEIIYSLARVGEAVGSPKSVQEVIAIIGSSCFSLRNTR